MLILANNVVKLLTYLRSHVGDVSEKKNKVKTLMDGL